MTDVWPIVHAGRHALAADLEQLVPDQWATPSLCADWDVHDVLVHLVATAKITRLRFLARFTVARFDFHRFTANGVAAERAADPAATLAESAPCNLERHRRLHPGIAGLSRHSSTVKTSGAPSASVMTTDGHPSHEPSNSRRK